jgi:hypothetical protein
LTTKRTKAEQKLHEHDIEVRTRVIVALLTNFDAADQRRVIDQVTAQLETDRGLKEEPDRREETSR